MFYMHLLVLFPYWHSFVFLHFTCVCIFNAICVHFLNYSLASLCALPLYPAVLPTTITLAATTTTPSSTVTTITTTTTTTANVSYLRVTRTGYAPLCLTDFFFI